MLHTVPTPAPVEHPDVLRIIGPYARWGKRLVDIVGSALLIAVLSPLLATTALCVRLSLGNGVLFRQMRVGRYGAPFDVVKFRSMGHDRRADQQPFEGTDRRNTHKTTDDPRHTRLGRIIRKWSLDELPQLFNVFRGEMSLVGPRPEILEVAQRYDIVDHPRHLVRPGITGLWQVSSERSDLLHENIHIDIDYVERVTLWGDLKILLRTGGAVLRGTGA